jgi:hypothetical protein
MYERIGTAERRPPRLPSACRAGWLFGLKMSDVARRDMRDDGEAVVNY